MSGDFKGKYPLLPKGPLEGKFEAEAEKMRAHPMFADIKGAAYLAVLEWQANQAGYTIYPLYAKPEEEVP